jgi:polygalacturonase
MLAAPLARPLLAVTAAVAKPQPALPALHLNVRDFSAVGDGIAKDTTAIQRALDRCAVLGGGEVLIPAGKYLTGALQLRSHVTLRFEADTTILGSDDPADYPVSEVRWEGKWIPGHISLFYAIDAQSIAIIGPGKIIGANALGGRPTKESPLRHPALIEPIRCSGVRLADFSTSYYRMWSIHPTECENVSISGLTIRSTGGNGDGIDVDSCRHVRIDHCDISTGDDCISLKSGRGEEGYTMHQPTEDVHITDCTFADSLFACIGIGSETSGGIRNVRITNCKFTAAKSHAIYIKSRPGRGPFLQDLVAEDLEVSGMQAGFLRINMLNSGIQDQDPVPGPAGIPTARNLRFANVHVTDCPVLVDAAAVHPDNPIEGFSLSNVTGTCAQGISLANIRGVILRNIHVTGFTGPLLRTHNVHGTGLQNAVAFDGPKLPDPVPSPAIPYSLH